MLNSDDLSSNSTFYVSKLLEKNENKRLKDCQKYLIMKEI